jgi:hypothetical protein
VKERQKGKKPILSFSEIFNRHFRALLSGYFSVRAMRTCHTFTGNYAWGICTYTDRQVTLNPVKTSEQHKKRHQRKNRRHSETLANLKKKHFIHFMLQTIPPETSLNTVPEL